MKTPIYNLQGERTGEVELPSSIFTVEMNPDLVHQVITSQMANRRQVSAHTKGRGEVSGGGRKPWRQKHTGRARHGSIRSPIWKGGGVAGGPTKERVFEKKINKKMKRKALFMVLSEKAKREQLVVVENLSLEKPKTKMLVKILSALPCKNRNTLLALPTMNKDIILAARNLLYVQSIQTKDLNALDALSNTYIAMPRESLKVIEETFSEKSKVPALARASADANALADRSAGKQNSRLRRSVAKAMERRRQDFGLASPKRGYAKASGQAKLKT